jgi:hypothetical protein
MKKLFLSVFAIIAAISFLATSCNPQEPTKEELLTQTKGWILTEATSEPPYIMLAEEGEEPEHLRDLLKGYFLDFEMDDIYFYAADGGLKVDPGKKLPSVEDLANGLGYDKVTTLGTWNMTYPKLLTKVPSFYDKNTDGSWVLDEVTITTLNESTLTYTYTWDVKEKSAKMPASKRVPRASKGDPERYTFTLTFSKK